MATIILDEFTGTNGDNIQARTPSPTNTPGNNWADPDDAFYIQDNRCEAEDNGLHLATVDAEASNVTVTCSARDVVSAAVGVVVRYADDSNFILALWQRGGNLTLFKRVAGTFTQLDAETTSGLADQHYPLVLSVDSANLITATINGLFQVQATDSAGSTNTKVGIYSNNGATNEWDDFTVDAGGGGLNPLLLFGRDMRGGLTPMTGGMAV